MAKPRLIAIDRAESKRPECSLAKAEITVGSDPGNALVLKHSSVSRRHAVIRRRGSRFEVSDLNSTNGTFVNEQRIQAPVLMNDRAEVRFGGVRFVFLDPRPQAHPTSRGTTRLRTRVRRLGEFALIVFLIGFGATEYLLNGDVINRVVRNLTRGAAPISTAQPASARTAAAAAKNPVVPPTVVPAAPVAVASPALPPAPTVAAGRPWLTRLNYYRQLAGLGTVTENDALSDGDYKHARYIVENYASLIEAGADLDGSGHTEDSDKPLYTPEGFAAAHNSDIYYGCSTFDPISAIDGWTSAPFHRLPILNPELTSVGFGEYKKGRCWTMGLDLHLGPEPKALAHPIEFPPPDATVSLKFDNDEWPNPVAAACPGYGPTVGLPITLEVGPWVDAKLGAHELLHGTERVEHCAYDASSYSTADALGQESGQSNLKAFGVVVMIPRRPLTPGETYTVSIEAQGKPYSWSFKVASKADPSH